MLIIGISPNDHFFEEASIVAKLFNHGMDYYHMRNKSMRTVQVEAFILEIPVKFHSRIILHSHHHLALKYKLGGIHLNRHYRNNNIKKKLKITYFRFRNKQIKITTSFHNLSGLFEETTDYDYVFLSPIFDSISNSGFQSGFGELNLVNTLAKTNQKVVALGGIDEDKISKLFEMGFYGMGLIGTIWENLEPVATIQRIKKECNERQSLSNNPL